MRESKIDCPREAEIHTSGCKCDFCGKSLDRTIKVWVWNEHLCCSRTCAQRAQGNTNALASAGAFKRAVEERDIDLL